MVVDVDERPAVPLEVWQDVADGAGRRYPAHLDTILDPVFGDWWADGFGLLRPPETFPRNRWHRDWQRRQSQWEVRVQKFRFDPPPRKPVGPPGWGRNPNFDPTDGRQSRFRPEAAPPPPDIPQPP